MLGLYQILPTPPATFSPKRGPAHAYPCSASFLSSVSAMTWKFTGSGDRPGGSQASVPGACWPGTWEMRVGDPVSPSFSLHCTVPALEQWGQSVPQSSEIGKGHRWGIDYCSPGVLGTDSSQAEP